MVYDASDMVMRKLAGNQSSQRSQTLGKLQIMRRERPARNGFGRPLDSLSEASCCMEINLSPKSH